MTTTPVDTEDIQTTRGEKVLAVVLTVFLLIGGIWAYEKLEVSHGYVAPSYTQAERAAISTYDAAQQRLYVTENRRRESAERPRAVTRGLQDGDRGAPAEREARRELPRRHRAIQGGTGGRSDRRAPRCGKPRPPRRPRNAAPRRRPRRARTMTRATPSSSASASCSRSSRSRSSCSRGCADRATYRSRLRFSAR